MNRTSFRPALESLEDRVVPTAYFWDPTASSANLATPGNYRVQSNTTRATTLPGSSDSVEFSSAACTAVGGSGWNPSLYGDVTLACPVTINDNWSADFKIGNSTLGYTLEFTGAVTIGTNSGMSFSCPSNLSTVKFSSGTSTLHSGSFKSNSGVVGKLWVASGADVTADQYFGYYGMDCNVLVGASATGTSKLRFGDLYTGTTIGSGRYWSVWPDGELHFSATDPMQVNTFYGTSSSYLNCWGLLSVEGTAPTTFGIPIAITSGGLMRTVAAASTVELNVTGAGGVTTGGYGLYVVGSSTVEMNANGKLDVSSSIFFDSNTTLVSNADSTIDATGGYLDLWGTLDMWGVGNNQINFIGDFYFESSSVLKMGYDSSGTNCDALAVDGDVYVYSGATFSWKLVLGALPMAANLYPVGVTPGHGISADFTNYNWNGNTWSSHGLTGGMLGNEYLNLIL